MTTAVTRKTGFAFLLALAITLGAGFAAAEENMGKMKLEDFLSSHSSAEKVVDIRVEPGKVYFENGRNAQFLNFDFAIEGLTEKELILKFLKVGVYDADGRLLTFRFLNHNGAGTPGIKTVGKFALQGKETLDIFNPFFEFPKELDIAYLRYTFTFLEKSTGKEFYYGDIRVKPERFAQKTRLSIPLKGLMVVTDGHDYYSHHRRLFALTEIRAATDNVIQSNFGRFSVDLTLLGADGNMRRMNAEEKTSNYDFQHTDIRKFYMDGAPVFSPADGEVVETVQDLDDLYDSQFDEEKAARENRLKDYAGNYVIIKHCEGEFSHLYHLQKDSLKVKPGDKVRRGQELGRIGFSGAASLYSHLHYQLLSGKDFFKDAALPFRFSGVTLVTGGHEEKFNTAAVDTGDFIYSK